MNMLDECKHEHNDNAEDQGCNTNVDCYALVSNEEIYDVIINFALEETISWVTVLKPRNVMIWVETWLHK